jgi:hypothetical protein
VAVFVNRRGASVLLIPLLAAMALFYPVATPKNSLGLTQTLGSSARENSTNKTKSGEWQGGLAAVQRFFVTADDKEGRSLWQKDLDPRQNASLKFLIVTVPDPVDSGLPHVYDRYMAAIQAAVQTQSYFLSKFDLPWEDCLSKGKDKDDKDSDDAGPGTSLDDAKLDDATQPGKPCKDRRFAREPGFLLLSNPTDQNHVDLLLVYLVGETPTAGIQKKALITALNEISRFCGWQETNADPATQSVRRMATGCSGDQGGVRILGPSYSGSAQSLDLTLSYWLDSIRPAATPNLRLVSGSATAINVDRDFHNTIHRQKNKKDGFSFASMELPDPVAQSAFCAYLKANAGDDLPVKVAILSEGGTVYGHQEIPESSETPVIKEPDEKSACEGAIDQTALPYPAHISQLRAVSEKLRQSQQDSTPQAQVSSKTLPLAESLEDAGLRRDIRTFSPANAVTAEQVMSNLLSTIAHEHYNYVGILATDSRDTMFLAQEVREHSPATVLFTFGPDLLFLHPEINQTLRGMLIVTSYPLTSSNQLWSLPSHPEARLQFADDGTEGVYNAALTLLGKDDLMLDYGLPFDRSVLDRTISQADSTDSAIRPPLWITVVGRDRLWPVNVYDSNKSAKVRRYTYGIPAQTLQASQPKFATAKEKDEARAADRKSWWRGLYSQATVAFVTAFAVLCMVFTMPLLHGSHRPPEPPQKDGAPNPPPGAAHKDGGLTLTHAGEAESSNLAQRAPAQSAKNDSSGSRQAITITEFLDRFLGEADSEKHRRAGAFCLLAGCASLGTFLLVLVTALFIPLETMGELGAWGTQFWIGVILVVISGFGLTSLVRGSVALVTTITTPPPKQTKPEQTQSKQAKSEDQSNWLALKPWMPVAAGSAAVVILASLLSGAWIIELWSGNRAAALFTSMRSLEPWSGISALVPLFLISIAGFVWALGSFQRIRQLDAFEGQSHAWDFARFDLWSFPPASPPVLQGHGPSEHLSHYLKCPSLQLPASTMVSACAVISGVYLWSHLVRSLEQELFYWLLALAFSFVSLAIWHAVLRFCFVWRQTHCLLTNLSLGPLRSACKRFRAAFPALPKIDLASSAAALAHLECSVIQARTLILQAKQVLQAKHAAEAGEVQVEASGGATLTMTNDPENDTFQLLSSDEIKGHVDQAAERLVLARTANAEGNWRAVMTAQCACREELSEVAAHVITVLQTSWWTEMRQPSDGPSDASTANREKVFRLGEDFLAGRLAHLLATIFPHMQNLIFTSVAGLLLLLFAVSSYPFQPHNVLLLFNWVIILSVVGIALGVFIQMSRDPVLSHLNGTKPGQISWDSEFVFRIFTYGIVPILALLGAQFPQSVGQILSHLVSGDGAHP